MQEALLSIRIVPIVVGILPLNSNAAIHMKTALHTLNESRLSFFLHRVCVCVCCTCCSFTFTEKLWLQQEDALQLGCCGVPTHTHVRTQPAGSQGKATNQTGFLSPFLSSAVFCSQWEKGRGGRRVAYNNHPASSSFLTACVT